MPIFVTYQINGKKLVKEVGFGPYILLIQSMQNRMPGTVCRSACTCGLAAKWALIDLTAVQPGERNSKVFQLVNQMGC